MAHFFGVLNSTFFKHGSAWAQDGLQEASGIDFGSILEGFGEEFGRIWSLLNKEWSHFGYAWHDLALLQQSL